MTAWEAESLDGVFATLTGQEVREATVDLARLAGLTPAGVLIEILNGTGMAITALSVTPADVERVQARLAPHLMDLEDDADDETRRARTISRGQDET